MKTLILIITFFLISACVFPQGCDIIGVLNSTTTDKSFGEGQEAIKASILDSLVNLNLYEYAHSLSELYELMHSNKVTIKEWDNYIYALLSEVLQEKKDTIPPFYATEYKGIIPLQAKFFVSSLEINTKLKDKYPVEYENLKNSTSNILGKGYSYEDIDSLLILFPQNSTVGTTNFWFFLQVCGCPIIELGINKEGKERVKMLLGNLNITSTYKIPLELQLRKARTMKQHIQQCLNSYEFDLDADVLIMDNHKDYYKKYLEEGLNLDKMKEF